MINNASSIILQKAITSIIVEVLQFLNNLEKLFKKYRKRHLKIDKNIT